MFIAIYNDQGLKSKIWWIIKFIYNNLPSFLKKIYLKFFELFYYINYTVKNLTKLNYKKFKKQRRGMNFVENLEDWIGGYPFEYSSIKSLERFYLKRNFKILKSIKSHGSGCHEILMKRH
jgi:2-polyprenyl-6-hydroxyphenyl methylase/3-demethylubiquinone-9 3-methyltransferase